MARNLTDQVRSISEVTKAVARGDLSKMVQVDVQGEMLELKTTVNQMVSRLSTLASEARESNVGATQQADTRLAPAVGGFAPR